MGQAARKFEVFEGGGAIAHAAPIAPPIETPLGHLEKWLSVGDLQELASIGPTMAKKALSARRWRGVDLIVRQVEIGRGGAGGMAPQVHVDSLPADLREAWYLARGVVLHERVDQATGGMGQAARKFEVFEGGCSIAASEPIEHPIAHPLRNQYQTPHRILMMGKVGSFRSDRVQ